jgi:TonB family protein
MGTVCIFDTVLKCRRCHSPYFVVSYVSNVLVTISARHEKKIERTTFRELPSSAPSSAQTSVIQISGYAVPCDTSQPRRLILRKLSVFLLPLLLLAAAQGQSSATAPCQTPRYPVPRITNKLPAPPSNWRAPQSAEVGLDLTIDRNGNVKGTAVIYSGGRDADEAILKTVRNWRYVPAMCDLTPVEMKIHVKFNLGVEKP